jgi:hypothetical protein
MNAHSFIKPDLPLSSRFVPTSGGIPQMARSEDHHNAARTLRKWRSAAKGKPTLTMNNNSFFFEVPLTSSVEENRHRPPALRAWGQPKAPSNSDRGAKAWCNRMFSLILEGVFARMRLGGRSVPRWTSACGRHPGLPGARRHHSMRRKACFAPGPDPAPRSGCPADGHALSSTPTTRTDIRRSGRRSRR